VSYLLSFNADPNLGNQVAGFHWLFLSSMDIYK
jgi:hypothetical protein